MTDALSLSLYGPNGMTRSRTALLLSFLEPADHLDEAELACVVSDMCINDGDPLTHNEAIIAYDILERLYPGAEHAIRRRLAEQFAVRDDIPHSLLVLLANDQIEIARPVIMLSPRLNDDDLIKIIVERTHEHRLAVSVREDVSSKVCDVLVYLGDEDVILNLVRNQGARFSDHAFKRVVTISRTTAPLHQPLLLRPEMRAEMAALMYQWVGQALKQFIAQNYGEALSARLDAEISQASHSALHEESVRQTHAPSSIPSGFGGLMVALRNGDMKAAETEMQHLTRLPVAAVHRILYHDNGEALAVVCRAVGADRCLFSEVVTRLQARPPYSTFISSKEYAVAMAAFKRLSQRQAEFVLSHWREKPTSVWGNPGHVNEAWNLRHKDGERF